MKNKAQKNGYKHTLQKRFLTLLLVSIILASGMIGGAGIASAQRVINEDSSQIMNLLCEQKASEINLMLKEIASSVDMDYSYVSRRLSQDRSMWNDTEYMEDYMQHVHDELDNTARNTSAAVSIYMRLNPDIFRTTQGVFLVKNAIGKFTERAPTDIQAYDPTDREHVGWYYEPIEQGQAIWMEPYYNQNTRVYMTSYVIPIYRDDTLIGVIGMDISMEKLQDSVKNLSAYDTGYAFLVSDDGDLVYHKDYENGITVDQFDDNLTQVHDILDTERIEGKIYSYTWKGASKRLVYKKLTNNMYLVLCAPASEIDVSRNSLAMQCLVILFVVLLIASIAGIHMVHRITKPLRGLTEAAKQVAGGDWNAKIEAGAKKEKAIYEVLKQMIHACRDICFDGNGYSEEWKAEAARRGLDCETSTPRIFDRYLDRDAVRMFGDMGVLSEVELQARTEVKWETYTKKIQIEGRVLGDLAMNHIVPIASKYEALLLDKVYKMSQIPGLNASADIALIKKIQDHTAAIQKLTGEMIDARKVANRIEDQREKAVAYHDTVASCFDAIRYHIDKLEEIVDDQIWPLPKYRELLFLR